MEHIGNGYMAYSAADLLQLTTEAERLNKSNLLETILNEEGFVRETYNLYSGKDPQQIIELSRDEKGISYINKLQEADRGQVIQFLQNRLMSEHYVVPNQHLNTFLTAVNLALAFEEGIGTKQKIISTKPVQKKRRGRGL